MTEELKTKIIESFGEVSMCWDPKPTKQIFDSAAALKIAYGLIAEIENLFAQTKWVSTENNLPGKPGRYLAICSIGNMEIRYFDGSAFTNYEGYRVIMWMPLPEPPINQ